MIGKRIADMIGRARRLERLAVGSVGAGSEAFQRVRVDRWFERSHVQRAAERIRAVQRRGRDAVDDLKALEIGRIEQ